MHESPAPPRKPPANMSKKPKVSLAKSSRAPVKSAAAVAKRPVPKPKKKPASPPTPNPLPVSQNGSKKTDDQREYRELLLTLRARVRGDVEQMTSEALDRN